MKIISSRNGFYIDSDKFKWFKCNIWKIIIMLLKTNMGSDKIIKTNILYAEEKLWNRQIVCILRLI